MQLSSAVKPISEVKAKAAELIAGFQQDAAAPVIITQNGEARAVLMGIHEYEAMRETMALLKALSLSGRSLKTGEGKKARDAFTSIRKAARAI